MKEDFNGCIVEYLIYIVETFFTFLFLLIANLPWILLAIIFGAGIHFLLQIIEKGF